MENLAIFGGPKAKTTPFGKGERFGKEELKELQEALNQNTLFYWAGKKVKEFNEKFSKMYGMKYCVAASSGTAAIHVALGAVGVTCGDEVITTPITDMGSLIGILYQNAVPVFADVDPDTYNIDAKSIESKITAKTKAILVVHLAGNAADMDAIMEVANRYNLKVIEDCAQSYMTYYKGKLVGTIGDIGCFSLNDFKHISAGDGGMILLNDEETYKTALRFADKNYNRLDANMRDIPYLAPNYRMNELTGAVGLAQLNRLEWICNQRNQYGEAISAKLRELPGVNPPKILEGGKSSYWFYMLRIDEKAFGATTQEVVDALNAEGILCRKGYIPTCVYEYDLFTKKQAYLGTNYPFEEAHQYYKGMCPIAEEILETAVNIPMSEFYTQEDIDQIIKAFQKISYYYQGEK